MVTNKESFEDNGVPVFLDHLDMHFDKKLWSDKSFGLCIASIDLHSYSVRILVQNSCLFHVKSVPECILLLIFSQLADICDNLHVGGALLLRDRKWSETKEW